MWENLGRVSGTFWIRSQSPQEIETVLANQTSDLVVSSCLPGLCILYLRPSDQLPIILLKYLFRRPSVSPSSSPSEQVSIVNVLDITELFYLVSDERWIS